MRTLSVTGLAFALVTAVGDRAGIGRSAAVAGARGRGRGVQGVGRRLGRSRQAADQEARACERGEPTAVAGPGGASRALRHRSIGVGRLSEERSRSYEIIGGTVLAAADGIGGRGQGQPTGLSVALRSGATWTASTPIASPTRCASSPRSSSFPASTPTRWRCGAPSAASSRPSRSSGGPSGARRSARHDDAVTAATATGAPGRIDDETRGLALTPSVAGERAGTLLRARGCYVCKQRYVEVDAFYHQLCPACAARNHAAARRPDRPDRPPRAAHRRPRQDRDVHRAAPAARRRAHDDHHALPPRRGPALRRDGRQRRLAGPPARRRASTCAIPARSSRWPTTSPPRARWTSSSTTPRRPCAARPRPTRTSPRPRRCRCRAGRCPRS